MSRRVRGDESEAMRYRPSWSDLPMFAESSRTTGATVIVDATPVVKARRVLDHFEDRKPTNASLAYVRGKLVELYDWRVRTLSAARWWVSADDADDILKRWSEFPSGGSQSWRGAIFRTKGWERVPGDVPSERPSHNGTPLARWRPRR